MLLRSSRQTVQETHSEPVKMFTAHGFSLQLSLANSPLSPTSSGSPNSATTALYYIVPPSSLTKDTAWQLQWRDDRPASETGPTSGSVFAEAGEGWSQDLVGTAKSMPGEQGIASVQGVLKDSHSRVTFTLVIDFDSSSPRKKNHPHAVFTLVVSDSTASSPNRLPTHLEQAAPVHTSQTSPQISSPTHPRPPMVEITAAEYLKLQREVNMATRKAEAAHSATTTLLSTLPLPSRIAALDADLRAGSSQNPPMSPEKRFQQGKQKLKLMQELQARSTEAVKGELVGVVKGVLRGTGRSVG